MIAQQEYLVRRKKMMEQLGPDGVMIIPAAPVVKRTESAEYPYRQSNNFSYLCGFPEPHATLVLTHNASILFCQNKNPQKEIWTGRIIGQHQAKKDYGFDEVYSHEDFETHLAKITQGKIDRTEEMLGILTEMRLIKSDAEIALMAKAASISALAHKKAMNAVRPDMMEYELAALYEYEFKINGANGIAYESIVGGGGNACILHYRDNNAPLKVGDLVLVDAACEYQLYAADITRTFPVDGKFSDAQRQVYQVVLNAQVRAINMIKPGITWESVNKQVGEDILDGLIDIGLLKGVREQLLESRADHRFYMHSCGHWLGLDVHDVGKYKINDQSRKLEKNMVVTVEPGIYIQPADDIDPRWHNIGVRIEDDVQVTHAGSNVLSHEAPKELDAIEAVSMANRYDKKFFH